MTSDVARVAHEVIECLKTRDEWVLKQYQINHAEGQGQDFVYIEEAVSRALNDLGGTQTVQWFRHHACCGLVFGWLLGQFGIEPPRWWVI